MDIIPDEKLPAPSMQWGKDMTAWRRQTEQRIARGEIDNDNNLKQLNSSTQLLSGQVSTLNTQVTDVLGRKDYLRTVDSGPSFGVGAYGIQTGSIISTTNPAYQTLLTITINEPRAISTSMTTSVTLGQGTFWRADIYINGVKLVDGHPSTVSGSDSGWATGYIAGDTASPAGVNTFPIINSMAMAKFALIAGTHTIEYKYWTQGTIAGSYSSIQGAGMRISVLGIYS